MVKKTTTPKKGRAPAKKAPVKRKPVHKKSGRPTKAEEFRTFELGRAAIIKKFKTEAKFWEFIAENAMESKDHLKMLIEYTYGKAPSEINVTGHLDTLTVPDWFKDLPTKDDKGSKG